MNAGMLLLPRIPSVALMFLSLLMLLFGNVLSFTFIIHKNEVPIRITKRQQQHCRNGAMGDSFCDSIHVVQELLTNQGVTSLDVLSPSSLSGDAEDADDESQTILLAAGTKRGNTIMFNLDVEKLRSESLRPNDEIYPFSQCLQDERFQQKPYPIYSMKFFVVKDGNIGLACGGGDRYLTIWQVNATMGSSSIIDADWRIHATLGPHTGWVKDVAFDGLNHRLYSIGCNCIEAWGINESMSWHHLKKRTIESSPDGATLSSDLLCLTMENSNLEDTAAPTLLSAGVDGRVHVWPNDLIDACNLRPLRSVRAHDGRVNAIATARLSTATLLLSVSNDGTLQCRVFKKYSDKYIFDYRSVLSIGGDNLRMISMSCVTLAATSDSGERVLVAMGTSDGHFTIAEVQQSKLDEELSVQMNRKMPLAKLSDGSIHAIVNVPWNGGDGGSSTSQKLFAVGHSNGLTLVSCST